MQKLEVSISEIEKTFGDIVILEGDNNIYDEYNRLAFVFKDLYKGKEPYKVYGYDRLWDKTKEELVVLFRDLLSSKRKITLVLNTTGTRDGMIEALGNIAKEVYDEFKRNGTTHNIVYLIEQHDGHYFSKIAKTLDINYLPNLSFIRDTVSSENREVLRVGYVKNIKKENKCENSKELDEE